MTKAKALIGLMYSQCMGKKNRFFFEFVRNDLNPRDIARNYKHFLKTPIYWEYQKTLNGVNYAKRVSKNLLLELKFPAPSMEDEDYSCGFSLFSPNSAIIPTQTYLCSLTANGNLVCDLKKLPKLWELEIPPQEEQILLFKIRDF